MKHRLTGTVAGAAIAAMLLGSCSDDDGVTTLARGEDIDFVGTGGLRDETMDITAEEEDGDVTGEVSFDPHGSAASLQCANTEADGTIVLAGAFTTVPDGGDEAVGQWIAVAIREGDPDSALVWFADLGPEAPESCDEALDQVPDLSSTGGAEFADVEAGDDIETG